jgi:hypothetical protein
MRTTACWFLGLILLPHALDGGEPPKGFYTRYFAIEFGPNGGVGIQIPPLHRGPALPPPVAVAEQAGPAPSPPAASPRPSVRVIQPGYEELPSPAAPAPATTAPASPAVRVAPVPYESHSPTLLPSAPLPIDGAPQPAYIMTHVEFARGFRPVAGNYEVVLLHPCTGRPVKVCFSLPHGCPEEIHVERDEIEFEYDDVEVEIEFKRDGRVRVNYDD